MKQRRVFGFTLADPSTGIVSRSRDIMEALVAGGAATWTAPVLREGVFERLVIGSDDLPSLVVQELALEDTAGADHTSTLLASMVPAMAFHEVPEGSRVRAIRLNVPVRAGQQLRIRIANGDSSVHTVLPSWVYKRGPRGPRAPGERS